LTEITRGGSQIFFVCSAGVWQRNFEPVVCVHGTTGWELLRGELRYLAPLGSENISAPYFKQYFFQGGITPLPRLSQTPHLPVPRQK